MKKTFFLFSYLEMSFFFKQNEFVCHITFTLGFKGTFDQCKLRMLFTHSIFLKVYNVCKWTRVAQISISLTPIDKLSTFNVPWGCMYIWIGSIPLFHSHKLEQIIAFPLVLSTIVKWPKSAFECPTKFSY